MEVKITHLDRVKFAIQARSHTIVCDQPAENGGEDSGMTPPELLLASLGSCAAFYAVQYLKTRNLAESGVEVSVTRKAQIAGTPGHKINRDHVARRAAASKDYPQ
jgi:putative redox protein